MFEPPLPLIRTQNKFGGVGKRKSKLERLHCLDILTYATTTLYPLHSADSERGISADHG